MHTPDNTVESCGDTDDESSAPASDWYGHGSWATDPRYTLEEKIRRWQVSAVMRQRNITWKDLREELGGISAARLGQMLKNLTDSEHVALRLEAAIDAITERRHAARCRVDEGRPCDDLGCAVYTNCYTDDSLIYGKKGELNEWRKWNAEALSGNTQTASRVAS